MREIEFRGLRTDGKGWVYGYLIRNEKISGIIPDYEISFTCDGNALDFGYIQVIPESVGQFTGVRDKNGVKIFEGDRLRHLRKYNTGHISVCKVIYRNGGFYLDYDNFIYMESKDINRTDYTFEVIGNIHEINKV